MGRSSVHKWRRRRAEPPLATVPLVTECLFCRIVAGDVPAEVVATTERTVAFRDVAPKAPTHVLVVPKEHVVSAAEVGPEHAEVVAELLTTARSVAQAEGVAERGYRLVLNVGDDALNSVPHLHVHVLGGRRMGWPPG
jgi:histidine triad (HIT) family protein